MQAQLEQYEDSLENMVVCIMKKLNIAPTHASLHAPYPLGFIHHSDFHLGFQSRHAFISPLMGSLFPVNATQFAPLCCYR